MFSRALNHINFTPHLNNICSKVVSLFQQRVTYVALGAFSMLALAYVAFRKTSFQAKPVKDLLEIALDKARETGELNLTYILMDEATLIKAVSKLAWIKKLTITWMDTISQDTIKKIAPHLQSLTDLDIQILHLDGNLLADLLKVCPQLENLSLKGSPQLTLEQISAACQNSKIRHLALPGIKNFPPTITSGMFKDFFSGILSFDFSGSEIVDDCLIELTKKGNLLSLSLNECKKLTSAGIINTLMYNSFLEKLNLENSLNFSAFESLFQYGHSILRLNLNGCQKLNYIEINEHITSTIKTNLKNLTHLHLQNTGLSQERIEFILNHCESLEVLSLDKKFPKNKLPKHLKDRIDKGLLKLITDNGKLAQLQTIIKTLFLVLTRKSKT